jgi:hypothetical protein
MKIKKETIGTLFNNGKSLYLFLCGIILINILPLPYFGIETGHTEPIFSIKATNEPLDKVLTKISKSTGYKIEMKKDLADKLLTVSINKLTLGEGLREIFRIIEEPNYAIVIDDSMKKVEIRFFNASSGNSSVRTNSVVEDRQKQNEGVDAGTKPDSIDNKVMPPDVRIKGPAEQRQRKEEQRQKKAEQRQKQEEDAGNN